MSKRTTVRDAEPTLAHDDATTAQTLTTLVEDALEGLELETVVYRENAGTLDEPSDEWQRYETVADLPAETLDGWDELYAYTETHVYRWMGVGFANGPEVLPRDPSSLPMDD